MGELSCSVENSLAEPASPAGVRGWLRETVLKTPWNRTPMRALAGEQTWTPHCPARYLALFVAARY